MVTTRSLAFCPFGHVLMGESKVCQACNHHDDSRAIGEPEVADEPEVAEEPPVEKPPVEKPPKKAPAPRGARSRELSEYEARLKAYEAQLVAHEAELDRYERELASYAAGAVAPNAGGAPAPTAGGAAAPRMFGLLPRTWATVMLLTLVLVITITLSFAIGERARADRAEGAANAMYQQTVEQQRQIGNLLSQVGDR